MTPNRAQTRVRERIKRSDLLDIVPSILLPPVFGLVYRATIHPRCSVARLKYPFVRVIHRTRAFQAPRTVSVEEHQMDKEHQYQYATERTNNGRARRKVQQYREVNAQR